MSGGMSTTRSCRLVGRSAELAAAAVALGGRPRDGLVLAGATGVGRRQDWRTVRLAGDHRRLRRAVGRGDTRGDGDPAGALAPLLPPRPAGSRTEGVDAVRQGDGGDRRCRPGRPAPASSTMPTCSIRCRRSWSTRSRIAARCSSSWWCARENRRRIRSRRCGRKPMPSAGPGALGRDDVDRVAEGSSAGRFTLGWRTSCGGSAPATHCSCANCWSPAWRRRTSASTGGRWRLDGRFHDNTPHRPDRRPPRQPRTAERRALELAFGEPITATIVEAMTSPEAVASIQRRRWPGWGGEGDEHGFASAIPCTGRCCANRATDARTSDPLPARRRRDGAGASAGRCLARRDVALARARPP